MYLESLNAVSPWQRLTSITELSIVTVCYSYHPVLSLGTRPPCSYRAILKVITIMVEYVSGVYCVIMLIYYNISPLMFKWTGIGITVSEEIVPSCFPNDAKDCHPSRVNITLLLALSIVSRILVNVWNQDRRRQIPTPGRRDNERCVL